MAQTPRTYGASLFEQGKALIQQGNYAAAAEMFTLSFNQGVKERNTKLVAVSLKMAGDVYRLLKKVAAYG